MFPFIIIPLLLLIIISHHCCFAESIPNSRGRTIDSTGENADCRCAEEETFSDMLRAGVFKSPGFPSNYCDLLNCKWIIQPAADTFVSASLDYFETEHKYDLLEVYQTFWNNSQLLMAKQATLSGNFDPRTMERHFFSSLGGGLVFRFVTDRSDHGHNGFQLSFQRHNKDDRVNAPCPPFFHVATQPPQNLPPLSAHFRTDSSCIFVINSTEATKLTVKRMAASVLTMEVYETDNFEANREKMLMRIKSPGGVSLPTTVVSRTSSITILVRTATNFFYNFGQSSLGGGNLYEIQFEREKSICGCFPAEMVVSRAHPSQLLSPGFPLEYCDQHNCSTRISLERPLGSPSSSPSSARVVEVLRLRFAQFQLEAMTDYIILKAIPERNMAAKLPLIMLTENARDIRQFTFDSSQFALDFITDISVVDIGFNLSLEAYKKPIECICPGTPLNILVGYKHSEQNEFNAEMCRSMDCFWEIRPPKLSVERLLLKLNHTLVDTETLSIFQSSEDSTSDRRFFAFVGDSSNSGEEHTLEFDRMSGHDGEKIDPVRIWYHREWPDDAPTLAPDLKRQFSFAYEWREACKCDDTILAASTERWQPLHSPDYPHAYCRSIRCQWLLNAPIGHHLLLNITQFATEADQDFLTIFDGNDTTRKHMDMLSGLIKFKQPLHSETNQMTLLFRSDISIQLDGFEIWFKAVPNVELLPVDASVGGHPKLFLLLLFLMLALSGTIFLIVRSRRNGGGGVWERSSSFWTWASNGGGGENGIPGFVEGRVRYIRNSWSHHRRQANRDGEEEGDNNDDGIDHQSSGTIHSANNPLFNPFR